MKLFRNLWFWCLWVALTAVALIWAAYRFSWSGTGFQGKTVWDWLSLLIIPVALALVALYFNQMNTSTERQIALDKQQEDVLQAYIDRMSDLLLEKGLRTSQIDAEVRNVARIRTISVLFQLNVKRVEYVFVFLHEAGLSERSGPVVSLKDAVLSNVQWIGADLTASNFSEADLSKANLSKSDLYKADLSKASLYKTNLCESHLSKANLSGANLFRANLSKADLYEADLSGADLIEVNLSGADLTFANLDGTNLNGANLKDTKIDKSKLTPEQIAQVIWN